MDINDIFKPKHANLLSEICTQLRGATVTHTSYSIPSTKAAPSIPLNNKLPTLYYFEITSFGSYCSKTLVDMFYFYRIKHKATKAITAVNYPMPTSLSGSECLYVGKVRNGINERLSVHLGTGGSVKTAGLRLKEWLPKGVELTLHIYQIDNLKDAFLVDIFEEYLRRMHNPILGIK